MNKKLAFLVAILIVLPMISMAESVCLDNVTLVTNITYDGVLHNYTEPCINGCDNTTNSCVPAPFQQNLLLIGIIIAIIIAMGLIFKFRRH